MPFDDPSGPARRGARRRRVWLSSSTKEVLAITTVDGKPFAGGKPGPVFRRMHALFKAGTGRG